jgi:hypothetical protein
VTRGRLAGDWFGGPLAPLFGPGIRDTAVEGNKPGRLAWAIPHIRYFKYPEDCAPGDAATYIRDALNLDLHAELVALLDVPPPDPTTIGKRVHDMPSG